MLQLKLRLVCYIESKWLARPLSSLSVVYLSGSFETKTQQASKLQTSSCQLRVALTHMAAPASPLSNGYFPSYSPEYNYPPHGPHPPQAPPLPHPIRTSHSGHPPLHHTYVVQPHAPPPVDLPIMPHTPPYHPHVAAMMRPASPISPVPPSPVMQQTSPNSSTGAHPDKAIRHILSTVTKLQGIMSQIAESQGEILDRLSLLEQKGVLTQRYCLNGPNR